MKKMLSITLIYLTATLLFCETSFAYIGYNDVYTTYNFSDTVTFHRGDKSHCYFVIGMGNMFWTNCNNEGTFKGWTNVAYSPSLMCGNIASTTSTYTLVYPESGDYQDTIYMHYISAMAPQACIPSKVFIQIPPEGTSCRSNFLLETDYGNPTVIFNEQAIVAAPDSIVSTTNGALAMAALVTNPTLYILTAILPITTYALP